MSNKKNKVVIAYTTGCANIYFSKDVFLTPYYIAKAKSLPLEYYYGINIDSKELPDIHRDAKIIGNKKRQKFSKKNEIYDLFKYVIGNYKRIDTLFIIGYNFYHLIIIFLLKTLSSSANIVMFGDMEPSQAENFYKTNFYKGKGVFSYVKNKLADFCFTHSLFLVANSTAHEILQKQFDRRGWFGLKHFYPCLDNELFDEYEIISKSWGEKENLIVCVGRIGNHQKNTEMLLDALKRIDLKDWKVYMIGPITSSFNLNEESNFSLVIEQFYKDYPQYKDKLIFTGMIYDQKEIFKYYNRAKVLLMTSRHESFGNVYSEAAALGCYILSTNVGGASLVSNNWKYGTMVEQDNSNDLAIKLSKVINGEIKGNDRNRIETNRLLYTDLVRKKIIPYLK